MITRRRLLALIGAGALMMATGAAPRAAGTTRLVLTGTFTDTGASEGIYAFRFDERTGTLTSVGLAAKTASPAWLALHPDGRHLYAVNEEDDGKVSAFALDPATGALTFLNQQSSHGARPCHLVVDPSGRALVVANYSSGTLALLPIDKDGRLGEATAVVQHAGKGTDPQRQEGPHAHQAVVDPSGRFLLAVDLGLDKVFVYALDAARGTLVANDLPAGSLEPGAGPRHLVFAPGGRRIYVINELASSISTIDWDGTKGALALAGPSVSTLPAGFTGKNSTAEIALHPSGRFLYGSNRGHDSIALFSVDAASGRLTAAGHTPAGGRAPRHFALDPTGRWLLAAGQDSNTLGVFAVDQATGRLTPAGTPLSTPRPVHVLFVGQ